MRNVQLLKESGIDVEKGMELLGDIDIYDETLQDFLDEMVEREPKIEEFFQSGDMENYAILVHALKGDSNYLGFTNLANMSLEHQLKSQENNISYVKEHYMELKNEMMRVMKVVKKYLEG